MIRIAFLSGFSSLFFLITGCSGGTVAVDSGTYDGVIAKVVPDELEIYVQLDEERTLELYFTDETELIQGGETADFSVLEKGQAVKITVERFGNRVDPVRVELPE
jgi:uncharacterized membrane protein